MKPLQKNSLDEFIKEQLKLPYLKLPLAGWAEVETLLGTQKQPLSFSVDKKILKPVIVILIAVAAIFGIVKLLPVISNLIPESVPEKNAVKENTIAPHQPRTTITTTKVIPAPIDSNALIEQKTDSMLKVADELSNKVNKTESNSENKSESANTAKKKKNQVSTAPDSLSIANDDIIISPAQDTVHAEKAIVIPSAVPTTDSTTNNSDTKSKKSKRGKNKKSSSDSSSIEKTKTDSLK